MGYRDLLKFLKSEQLINQVAVVVTPVQTIGNVVFAYHKTDSNDFTRFYYYKTPIHAPYAPQYGDQPLRYVLRFLINVYLERKQQILEEGRKNLENLEEILGVEQDEVKAIEKKLNQAQRKIKQREEMWGLFKGIANLWDSLEVGNIKKNSHPEHIHKQVKSQYAYARSSLQEVQSQFNDTKDIVDVTETQIQTFNQALFEFSGNCKDSGGFAVLQGFKWLSSSNSRVL